MNSNMNNNNRPAQVLLEEEKKYTHPIREMAEIYWIAVYAVSLTQEPMKMI